MNRSIRNKIWSLRSLGVDIYVRYRCDTICDSKGSRIAVDSVYIIAVGDAPIAIVVFKNVFAGASIKNNTSTNLVVII